MSDCIAFLAKLCGTWEGSGVNHEGQSYTGQLILDPQINPLAMLLHFTATGADGAVFHRETLMIGVQPDGSTAAFSISNNIPGLASFRVTQPSTESLVLTLGDIEDPNSFRELITFRLEPGGELFHGYSWAMPGELMQDRSSALLTWSNRAERKG
jgi:hypothetical protein